MIIDRSGSCLFANSGWALVAGGRTRHLLQAVGDADQTVMTGCLRALALGETPPPAVVRLLDGRWAQLQLQQMGGVAWMCIATDIHELKSRHDQLLERSRLHARLLDVSTDRIELIDLSGRLTYMNKASCVALDIDLGSGFGQVWLDLLPSEVQSDGEEALARARSGEGAHFVGHSHARDGAVEAWDYLVTPTRGEGGAVESILCVSRNVSEEHAGRRALAETKERLAMATLVGGLGVWDFDIPTNSLICDQTWHRIMGRDPDRPVTSMDQFRPLIHVDDLDRATEVSQTAASLIASGEDYSIRFRIVRPNGEVRWVRSAASLVLDHAGQPVRAVGFVVDITDDLRGQLALEQTNRTLEQERAMLEKRSLEDPLTGLPNRRALSDALARTVIQAQRDGSSFSVAMIDVDYFKNYNDHYGHLAGDQVLVAFSDCLREAARRPDLAARYGGEEFVLVLTAAADPAPALRRLFDLLADMNRPHERSPLGRVTISCGCVVVPPAAELDPDEILLAADQAMYQAKASGRNRFIVARQKV